MGTDVMVWDGMGDGRGDTLKVMGIGGRGS